jgi:hypothetical protein
MVLLGQGRHYVDIFARDGVEIGAVARGSDATGEDSEWREAHVSSASAGVYGVEIEASAECFYDVIVREGQEESVLRLYLSAAEIDAEGAHSEFERLIRVNRQDGEGRATTHVILDRQNRCSDMQAWALDPDRIGLSFYPVVIANDHGGVWAAPQWGTADGTILSRGRFLIDPRPDPAEMLPPAGFLHARSVLGKWVRGDDGNGLIEGARLGEMLATQPELASAVEYYRES